MTVTIRPEKPSEEYLIFLERLARIVPEHLSDNELVSLLATILGSYSSEREDDMVRVISKEALKLVFRVRTEMDIEMSDAPSKSRH